MSFGGVYGDWSAEGHGKLVRFHVPAGAPHSTGCVSEEPCLFYTHGDQLWDIQMPEEAS